MLIYLNLYGKNLEKLSLSDIDFKYLQIDTIFNTHCIDLAGYIEGETGEYISGKIKIDSLNDFMSGNPLDEEEIEKALSSLKINAMHEGIKFHVGIDDECDVDDALITSYSINVILNNTSRIASGDIPPDTEDELRLYIANFVSEHLSRFISSDYAGIVFNKIISDIEEDVLETSGFREDGTFTDDDIRLAVGRVLIDKLN